MYRATSVMAAALLLIGCGASNHPSDGLKFPKGDGEVVYQGASGEVTLHFVHEVTPGNPNWIVKQASGTTLIPRERILRAGPPATWVSR
jgi:hypothetical protein